jgi:hypothetical protein
MTQLKAANPNDAAAVGQAFGAVSVGTELSPFSSAR